MEPQELRNATPIYDVIILGASGFTGKYVLKETLKFINKPNSPLKTIALAGRNPRKLSLSLSWACRPDPCPEIDILEADTSDTESLGRLAMQARVLVNCVGPFRVHGDGVVKACVEAGTDYLDICGFLNKPNSPLKTLALAGRNPRKLSLSLSWAYRPDPCPEIDILKADTSDTESLGRLAMQARVLVNCVGPFRVHGDGLLRRMSRLGPITLIFVDTSDTGSLGRLAMQARVLVNCVGPFQVRVDGVVKACVEAGTDYLDIRGEPEFMERSEANYHDMAKESGALVVSACGFDSVPAEMGLMHNSRMWDPPAVPNSVEAYLCLESDKKMVGNFGTYESAVLGVANADKLQELRRSRPRRARPEIPGPPPPKGLIEHQKKIDRWAVKLPSADSIVVRRTLATLKENPKGLPGVKESDEHISKREAFWSTIKPAHFGVKLANKSLIGTLLTIMFGIFLGILGRFSFGRTLLLKFPSFFSLGLFKKEGPTEDQVASATFKMWFIGHGFSDINVAKQGNTKPDMEIVTRIMGPEIGYLTTPIIIVQCALIILSQRDNLPKGGVYTPGIVFGPTDLEQRLEENGISFDFISKGAISG